ncbi:MAG: T9SS type A sorting domain-containing protein [Bacteroidales bacterium]|nr:T9SS type A sorting domain-containing protein [Bacteroidales bacterium]
MKRLLLLVFASFLLTLQPFAQTYTFSDSWDGEGFNLKSQTRNGVSITYSVSEFTLSDIDIRGEMMKHIALPNHFLPGDEGAPDLPGSGRYIALPQGARPVLHIKSVRTETYRDVNVAPAPRIPLATEDGPLDYNKDNRIYSSNTFYPAAPVKLSEMTQIRGVDAVILGITPFQYNPVTRELIVYRDIEAEIVFEGGNGQFGEERLRSRWWDPILDDAFLNATSLPKVDYSQRILDNSRSTGYEYLIICPDDPVFISWADTIRAFRTMQGIKTGVVTTAELGGNTTTAIKNYVTNAYQNWDIPPAAVLLLGDYGSSGNSIISPIWNSYCVSDHTYADINGDNEEEMSFARMTARDATELETMIRKAIDYERNPPTNPDFYNKPITALGWQTERWFQICSETIGGYFKHVQGKEPVRINAIYSGNPNTDPWSTNPNTPAVLDVFGPSGLGYIPATPSELGGWTGGTPAQVNAALNAGSFLLQHRDHGFEYGWGEPDYQNDHINGLTNTDLSYILSINCLTGKYNHSQECFTEKFHRHTYNGQPAGALGLLAASETSYSFVNDAYVWGVFDNMFPDFLPQFGTTPESRGMLPAFGNTAGKIFLKYSSWPYNPNNKEVTYHLFHHHGDAFTCLYSEVPQHLMVFHEETQLAGMESFSIQADEDALVALSVNGELIGVGTGTGVMSGIPIITQNPPNIIDIVVTKQNHFRYHNRVQVVPPSGPYIVTDAYAVNDATGNNNGQLDYGETASLDITLRNLGTEVAENVMITVSSTDEFATIINNSAQAGTIQPNQTAVVNGAFSFTVAENVSNGYSIPFTIQATNGDTVWNTSFSIKAFAPVLEYVSFTIIDTEGNNNGRLDPDETAELLVSVKNKGGSDAFNITGMISSSDPFITIESNTAVFGNLPQNETIEQTFVVSALPITPPGHQAQIYVNFLGDMGIACQGEFSVNVGLFPILVLDLDNNHNSGPLMKDAIDDWRVFAEYKTIIPEDISQYRAIFLCLGTYNTNHVLTNAQAAPFVEFLNNGGRMYMEGADTWYYDQVYNATALHPMFKIQGLNDGSGDLSTLMGVAGTFVASFMYYFGGDNNYIDQIAPVSPAYTIFNNASPAYAAAVAHDAGTYKTIGSSFEFGGLLNNVQFTKKALMLKYLEFLGLNPITAAPSLPSGDTKVCGTDMSCTYTTEEVIGADYYIWELQPSEAGTIDGWGTEVTVNWTPGFKGAANLTVCGMNQSGMGPESPQLSIDVYDLPTAMMTLSNPVICQGDTTYLSVALTGTGPPWDVLVSFGGLQMTFNPIKPNIENIPVFPMNDMEIIILSLTDATGCENSGFEPINITVLTTPAAPAAPAGPEFVDLYISTQSSFSTDGSPMAETYDWSLEPSSAGSITIAEGGMSCTVDWEPSYTGQVELKVQGINNCGTGALSQALAISVGSSFGIADNTTGVGIALYPNPNSGLFRIELMTDHAIKTTVRIFNAAGEPVWGPYQHEVKGKTTLPVNLENLPDGMYMLQVETKKGLAYKKIILGK